LLALKARGGAKLKSFVVVIVVAKGVMVRGAVGVGFLMEIQLYRVQAHNYEARTAFVTMDRVTLFGFRVDENFFTAFGAN